MKASTIPIERPIAEDGYLKYRLHKMNKSQRSDKNIMNRKNFISVFGIQ
jgi:hypothetical protein